MNERLRELRELQDEITASRRDALIGSVTAVLVDSVGVGRSHREAPEIDGIVHVGHNERVGTIAEVEIIDAMGTDLVAAGADPGVAERGG
jgi:ribosomal protein S12 methylthiotransferase